jgi:hypothetical protein
MMKKLHQGFLLLLQNHHFTSRVRVSSMERSRGSKGEVYIGAWGVLSYKNVENVLK